MDSNSTQSFHIMMVDDDQDDALLFTYAMETLTTPYRFSIRHDGINLLNVIATERPNIVFLDLNMPTKNGYECLREIRSNANFDNIPVVIYSTSASRNEIDKCFKQGADKYVIKPFTIAAISTMINQLCNTGWINNRSGSEQFVLRFE